MFRFFISFVLCVITGVTAYSQVQTGHQWVYYGHPQTWVNNMIVTPDTVWASMSGGGVLRIDRHTGIVYSENNTTNNRLIGLSVGHLFQENPNKIWVTNYDGIHLRENGRWKKQLGNSIDTFIHSIGIKKYFDGEIKFNGGSSIVGNGGTSTNYHTICYNGQSFTFDSTRSIYRGYYDDFYKNKWHINKDTVFFLQNGSSLPPTYTILPNQLQAKHIIEDLQHNMWLICAEVNQSNNTRILKKVGNTWLEFVTPILNHANKSIYKLVFGENHVALLARTNISGPINAMILDYEISTNIWRTFDHDNGTLPHPSLQEMTIGSDGHLWCSFTSSISQNFEYDYENVIAEYNGAAWRTYNTRIQQTQNFPSFIATDKITGTRWTLLKGKLAKFDGTDWVTVRTTTGQEVSLTRMIIAPDQKIWGYIGYNDAALTIYDPVTNVSSYSTAFNLPQSVMVDIRVDNNGTIWSSNYYAIGKYINHQWVWYNPANSPIPFQYCQFLAIDESNNIWLRSIDDEADALVKLSPNNNFTIYNAANMPFPPPSHSFSTGEHYGFMVSIDRDNIPWIIAGQQLYKLINNNWIPHNPIPNDQIIYPFMQYDKFGRQWLMGKKGVYSVAQNGTWKQYTTENSSLMGYEIFLSFIDNNNNKWFRDWRTGAWQIYNERGVNIEDITQSPTKRTGVVFFDANQNGIKDVGEVNLAGEKVIQNSRTNYWSNDAGFIIYTSPNTTDTLRIHLNPNWLSTTPQTLILNTQNSIDSLFFGVYRPPFDSLTINMLVNNRARCFQPYSIRVSVQNHGNRPTNGFIKVTIDPRLIVGNTSVAPSSAINNIYTFDFNHLPSRSSRYFTIYIDSINTISGQTLQHQAVVFSHPTTYSHPQDSTLVTQTVVCSYDPNDKTGISNGRMSGDFSLRHDPLHYTIRFQNTGNDTAFCVIIRDTLSVLLDPNSFQLTAASHTIRVEQNGRSLKFIFNPIVLDYTKSSLENSQGFVSFRIKPYHNLVSPLTIQNTAYIYFDLNPPIKTNTTQNVLVDYLSNDDYPETKTNLTLSPNPTSDLCTISLSHDTATKGILHLYSIDGKCMATYANPFLNQTTFTIHLKDYAKGIYILEYVADDGSRARARVVRQ